MEISDVLTALAELKNGIEAVRSANANVERAAIAAHKVCEAFSACSRQLEGFPDNVMNPIRKKVAEIADASAQMVQSCSASVAELRTETKNISDAFNNTVANSCNRIQSDINEFHREIESLESKLSRVTSRVEEKTDSIVSEVRKMGGGVREEMQALSRAQEEAVGTINASIEGAKSAVKNDVATWADGLGKTVVHESTTTNENIAGAKNELLVELGAVKKVAILSVVIGLIVVACAAFAIIKLQGA